MPRPSTGPKNILNWSKYIVPDQKHSYILCWSQTFCARQKDDFRLFSKFSFCAGTKCFGGLAKKFGLVQNILEPVKGKGKSFI